MKINNQQMSLGKNEVIESFIAGMNIYSLEQRSDKLFLVRENRKTLSVHTVFAEAEDKFGKLKATKKGGEKMTDGEKQFKAVGEKLKAEKAAAEENAIEAKEAALTQLEQIKNNPELAKMYADSAGIGAENLGAQLPLLKVHATGRSTKNELADGTEPNNGWFFYKPTQEQFETLKIHVLTISKGFRAEGLDNKGVKKMVFNQILGGVIVDNGEYKPFVMYLTGLKLSNMWEFGKEASAWTKKKVPMFSLSVLLSTEQRKTEYGYAWIINFEIEKDANGFPVLITDPGEFQFLKTHVADVQETINSIIAAKTINGEVIEPTPSAPIHEADAQIGADDIPFN